MQRYPNQHQEHLQGYVERITFAAEGDGYSVARFKAKGHSDLLTIVGNFANLQAGATLALTGTWREHPKYGDQFQVSQYKELKPATLTGIEKYLGSGLIKGVGPVTAKRIVAHFGLETLDIIETQVQRLIEVPGIAKKRVKLIADAWETQKAIKDVMVFLQGHGVSTTYAVKIYKQYGAAAIATVTNNPYQLATDIYGIGFITADAIARHLGTPPESEFRYAAGILYALDQAAEDGHCFLPQTELIAQAGVLLKLADFTPDPEAIRQAIWNQVDAQLTLQGYQGDFACYQPAFYRAEQHLAESIYFLLQRPVVVEMPRVRAWIDKFVLATGMELSEEQRQVVEMSASKRVLILTGGPGTGKTHSTRAIVALWKAMGKAIALASPTGRAAQRLSEMTGLEAKTVHRLLEFDPKNRGFRRGIDNPLPADVIVVDEASMLDLFLANALVRAIKSDAQLLLVGDIDQLPSVGAGNVLADLIRSGQVPVVRLTQVFRQAQQSKIITNAHLINQGKYPQLEKVSQRPQTDCLWFSVEEPDQGIQAIGDIIQKLLPQLGFDPTNEVQLLAPMTRGSVGTRNLNTVLQNLLNPPADDKPCLQWSSTTFRVGDRVIQLKNDYDREVFNGDLGIVRSIDMEERELLIGFGERLVKFDYADLNELGLAWACTTHKAQGSEYPVVVLPIFMQHYVMLTRNLFYTALTRARKLAIIVGSQKAIALAVKQVKDSERYTLLAERLMRLEREGFN